MLGRLRFAPRLLLLFAVAGLVLEASAPAAIGGAPSSGITLTLGSDGAVIAGLETVATNGSALRYAMDGYFGPLVELLPGTNASRTALLGEISSAESNPLTAGLFGSRSGRVDSTDVSRFVGLIDSYAKYIPVTAITGVLNVTIDGTGPASDQLRGVSFSNAPGSDNSSAPIGLTATLAAAFTWSGLGNAHTFQVAWNLPSILGNLSLPVQAVNVSFATPTAITITSVTGLNATQISNDPFGWGSASVSGQYTPLPGHTVVIKFGPSFPTGDALIVGAIVIVAGLAVGLLLARRRRRRRQSTTPPPVPASTAEPGVGPSSGSE
ncbi:MAG: hypothetical protein WCB19_05275 [Thermoplasmata archaeon]